MKKSTKNMVKILEELTMEETIETSRELIKLEAKKSGVELKIYESNHQPYNCETGCYSTGCDTCDQCDICNCFGCYS